MGKEGRDRKKGAFFLSQVEEDRTWETDIWKAAGAKVKGQSQLRSVKMEDSAGRDSGGNVDVTCGVGGRRESSSHPRSLLSRWHLVIQVA